MLQHEPHGLDIIPSKTPVAPRLEIPQERPVLQPHLDAGRCPGDLAGHKRLPTPGQGLAESEGMNYNERYGF